ncbi:hypothetical protein C5167_050132 [Papaver somniferum]|uniref:Uncharacterized protein n=1 Tax=Papaver somniferum TaxID=3469 RepID=A0A4Y7KMR2_PAPSO|nr:uncharacterized protein At4g38062-like [Papaver somniferum]RZC74644.1 hypothetical protein C5167_050132 [Papaver somniferum]
MEKVCKELDDVKDERDKLKDELRIKESAVKHMCSANDKLRSDYGQKLQKLEGDNKILLIALDESNVKSNEQDQKLCTFKQEIEGLKELLRVSKKKCCEAEERGANVSKQLGKREDMCIKLEEENVKYKEQLKWKKEQFDYLEEAHKKMQDEFQLNKKEWAKEKLNLIEEISTLSTSLDSQIRISESLQSGLEMCNHALAHEESRRKLLEVEVSELKQCNESVLADYQEEKTKVESMTAKRDEEIASLRNSLGAKQTFSKEMEFRISHLEEENRVLRGSLKEFQEARIQDAGAGSSLLKIRNKLKGLEKVHSECSMNMKARESEFVCQTEKLMVNLNDCKSELDVKYKLIQELKMELELWSSLTLQLKIDNEEMYVLLVMYKSGFADAQSNLTNLDAAVKLCDSERREKIARLTEQLEEKNSSLTKAYAEIEKGSQTAALLVKKIESLDASNMSNSKTEMELYSKMKDEEIAHLMEELDQKNDLLLKACDEIEKYRENTASIEKKLEFFRASEQQYSVVQNEFERCKTIQVVGELDIQVKNLMIIELEEEIHNLQQKLELQDKSLLCSEQNEEHLQAALELKQSEIEKVQDQLGNQGRNLEGVIEKLESEKILLRNEIIMLTSEKKDFLNLLGDFSDRVNGFSDKGTELMARLERTMQSISKANELDFQVKSLTIFKLEEEIDKLQKKLELLDKFLLFSKQKEEHLEAALEMKQSEIEEVHDQLGNQQRTFEGVIEKLKYEKTLLCGEILKLKSEKKDFLELLEDLSDKASGFSDTDTELMARLEDISKAN